VPWSLQTEKPFSLGGISPRTVVWPEPLAPAYCCRKSRVKFGFSGAHWARFVKHKWENLPWPPFPIKSCSGGLVWQANGGKAEAAPANALARAGGTGAAANSPRAASCSWQECLARRSAPATTTKSPLILSIWRT